MIPNSKAFYHFLNKLKIAINNKKKNLKMKIQLSKF